MAFCSGCGSALAPGAAFCSVCGRRQEAPGPAPADGWRPPAVAPPGGGTTPADTAFAGVRLTDPIAAAVVFGACAAVSVIGWSLLAIPARIPTAIIGRMVPYGCAAPEKSFAMYLCSAKFALLMLIGPILVTILVFVYRGRLAGLVRSMAAKMPPNARFLVAPLVATVAFTLAWAGAHLEVAATRGIVSQRMFPAFIGLFTFATARWGPLLQERLRGFFDVRDRFPLALRVIGALLVPLVVSLLITYQDRVTQPVLKEQFVVLISIATGYLALAPRSGGLAGALKR